MIGSCLFVGNSLGRYVTAPPPRMPRGHSHKPAQGSGVLDAGVCKPSRTIRPPAKPDCSAAFSHAPQRVDSRQEFTGLKQLQVHPSNTVPTAAPCHPSLSASSSKWGSFMEPQPKLHQALDSHAAPTSKWGAFVDQCARSVVDSSNDDDGFTTSFD